MSSLQGNGTPGSRLSNSNSNHSPYFSRDHVNHQSSSGGDDPQPSTSYLYQHHGDFYSQLMAYNNTSSSSPTSSSPNHQLSIHDGDASSSAATTDSETSLSSPASYHHETQYLPNSHRRHFNSGHRFSSPQSSGQSSSSSPQSQKDQQGGGDTAAATSTAERPDTAMERRHPSRGLHLPCTLSSTSDNKACAPSGTHDASLHLHQQQLPPDLSQPGSSHHNHHHPHGNRGGGVDDDTQASPHPHHNIWRVGSHVELHHPPRRPESCTGSTGGDSGLVDDVDWADTSHDTSPNFIHKVLQHVSGEEDLSLTMGEFASSSLHNTTSV